MATSTADVALVAGHERLGLVQRIRRRDPVVVSMPEWLLPDQIDEAYVRLLPTGAREITAKEEQELAFIFGKNGELAVVRLS